MTEVARLLALSLQAHQDAKRARHEHQPAKCRDLWQQALEARVEAHALDLNHTDPAWQAEQSKTPGRYDTHAELMQFYAERGIVAYAPQTAPIPAVPRVPTIQEQLDSARAEIARLMESQDLGQKAVCEAGQE